MVDKKLLVTLVLDCCFSGSVVRYDNSTRFVEYDSAVAAAHRPVPWKSLGGKANRPIYRDAIMLPCWLVDPDRYTILAACRPREITREISDEHKRKVSALSFFLSDCMGRVNCLGARQRDVYGYLSVGMKEFRSRSGRQQTPMLYGNKYLRLFGVLYLAYRSAAIQIVRSASDTLQLQAGEAHDISVGDRFDIYSFKSIGEVLLVTAQVQRVNALTSDLELLGEISTNVRTGWVARAMTYLRLGKYPLPLSGVSPSTNIGDWSDAINERKSLTIYDEKETEIAPAFYQHKDHDNSYTIRDKFMRKIENLSLHLHKHNQINQILNTLEHLAKYKWAMNITDQRIPEENAFPKSFRVTLTNLTNNKAYLYGSQAMAQQGDRFELSVENKGSDTLHLHVYLMNSIWKIHSKFNGDYEAIPPPGYAQGVTTTGTWKRTLTMKVAQELERREISQREDIIKIFLALQATSFTMLELPPFGEPIKSTESVRNGDYRDSRQSEDWAALTFRIHTSRR